MSVRLDERSRLPLQGGWKEDAPSGVPEPRGEVEMSHSPNRQGHQGRQGELLEEVEASGELEATSPPDSRPPHEVPDRAEGRDDQAGFDTIPGAPAAVAFEDDEGWQALRAQTAEDATRLAGRAWDNLAHVEAFARAARDARAVLDRHPDDAHRRAVAHALWPLLPPPARGHAFQALPDDVARRAPDFPLRPGDVPKIAASHSAFLATPGIEAQLFQSGAGPFIVPRGVCPAGATGPTTAVVIDGTARGGLKCHVPASQWTGVEGERYDVRTGGDGRPLLNVEGRAEHVVVPPEVLGAYLFSAGPDARGLDLRSHNDRALLLVWCSLLRSRRLDDKSVFAWLEDESAAPAARTRAVTAAVDAAIEAVAAFAMDPLVCRITLRPHDRDGGWPQRAAALLDETGLVRDVLPRQAPEGFARDMVWLDGVLGPGYAAGRLSRAAAGRAFARLATSVLAPLGVLPLSGLKDGSGAVVLHRLLPRLDETGSIAVTFDGPRVVDFGAGLLGVPLCEAWAKGRGTALPEPRGAPRHDVEQLPAWLAFFLEGVGAT